MNTPSLTPKIIPMAPDVHEMMLQIHGGDARVLPLMHQVFNSPYRRPILQWLVAHHLSGAQFMGWFQVECKGSPMFMLRILEARIKGLPRPRLVEEVLGG